MVTEKVLVSTNYVVNNFGKYFSENQNYTKILHAKI